MSDNTQLILDLIDKVDWLIKRAKKQDKAATEAIKKMKMEAARLKKNKNLNGRMIKMDIKELFDSHLPSQPSQIHMSAWEDERTQMMHDIREKLGKDFVKIGRFVLKNIANKRDNSEENLEYIYSNMAKPLSYYFQMFFKEVENGQTKFKYDNLSDLDVDWLQDNVGDTKNDE